MLRFRYIEMRNFLSFGNVAQRVELDCSPLTIILGMNNDATNSESDEETRNGVGKSSVIQALNFAIYGKSVGNKIKVGNLVNKINKRHCEVTLAFEKDGVNYKIVRRRGPTDLKFFIGEDDFDELVKDEAQGDNRDSQVAITEIIGMSQELFQQIVTITTSVDSFLGLGSSKQRQIIEELLGITLLSEKADRLKEMLKQVKEAISREQFRVETIDASNSKIMESIRSLEQQSADWNTNRDNTISSNTTALDMLAAIDIDAEKEAQEQKRIATEHNQKANAQNTMIAQTQTRASSWEHDQLQKIVNTESAITQLSAIDIDAELAAHEQASVWKQLSDIQHANQCELLRLQRDEATLSKRKDQHNAEVKRLSSQLDKANGATCPTCGGALADEKHEDIVSSIQERVCAEEKLLTQVTSDIESNQAAQSKVEQFELPEKPVVQYANINDAYKHQANLEALQNELNNLKSATNPYHAQLDEMVGIETMVVPTTHYNNVAQVYQHVSALEKLTAENESLAAQTNPYDQQVTTLRTDSLQKVSYDELNRLRKMQEHQEFLIKLLTDKNSFVRKRIIDQNLSFLNVRLQSYMEKSGSMHNVVFMNDLSVDITKMGENYDFDNLSRGEKNRVIIALSMAFRDMFESLNFGVNTLMIDEILDNGLDKAGTNACYKMLNELSNQRDKNCFLITHREELQSRCENIMMVVMENSFTTVEQNDAESM